MSLPDAPTLEDYVRLFLRYGEDMGSIYLEPEDDRYALLFEQLIRLLTTPSAYTLSLPEPFRRTAHRWRDQDPDTARQLSDPANRHFMLCDVHDYVMLDGGLAVKRARRS